MTACAFQIKTWTAEPANVKPDCQAEKPLVRKKGGQITEALSILEMAKYRCYSEIDDTAWRNRMAICCADKN